MLRSCYLSDMVLSVGGPPVHGAWYFTSAAIEHRHNRYGSLVYWKGTGAAFSGIGEVARHGWRDGSSLPCQAMAPTPVCFHVGHPGFTTVHCTGGGLSNVLMPFGTGDTRVVAPVTFNGTANTSVTTSCGPPGHTGKQCLTVNRPGDSIIWREADAWDGNTVWTWLLPANYRDAWAPTTVTLTVSP